MAIIYQETVPEALEAYLTDAAHPIKPIMPIYIGEIPPAPDECIAISSNGSVGSTAFFGASGNINAPLIVILARSKTYGKGMGDCKIIRGLLCAKLRIDNMDVMPAGNIMYLGKDINLLHIFRANYKILIKE